MKSDPDRAPPPPVSLRAPRDLARFIDHTLLRPGATEAEVRRLCDEARQHGFAGVCVRGEWIALAARLVAGTAVRPVAVVDFPLGMGSTPEREREARRAAESGATEIDVVIRLEPLLAHDHRAVLDDLQAVVASARVPVKVIIETCRLSREEKVAACALAQAAGAAWVKTSTGFAQGGATAEDVALMRAVVGEGVGVKASGGIRTAAAARRMVEAGASRIGASASVAMVSAETFE